MIRSILAAVSLCGSAGCATLANSPTREVLVSSEPAGASVRVNDVAVGTTPIILTLHRSQPNAIGVAAEGYAPAAVALSQGSNNILLVGNLLLFHPAIAVVGLAVDLALGSHYTLNPSINVVRLLPIENSGPAMGATQPAWQPVPLGSTVRVQHNTTPISLIGVVAGFAGDTLLLQNRNSALVRIDRPGISIFEIALGRARTSSTLMGAAVGALSGCAAGYVVGRMGSERDHHSNGGLMCIVIGLPTGATVGAVVGMLRGRHRWQRVY